MFVRRHCLEGLLRFRMGRHSNLRDLYTHNNLRYINYGGQSVICDPGVLKT